MAAQTQLYHYFRDRGLHPKVIILDNECPLALKTIFRKEDVRFQLSPPNDHRTNPAEKAIDTWKCHFIAGLASVDPAFPVHLWCRLIRQCNLTLNLLRTSRINPRLSAEAQLNGAFDFNRTPLAPPGTKVIVHETPKQRATWDDHGQEAWYIGPAAFHYR